MDSQQYNLPSRVREYVRRDEAIVAVVRQHPAVLIASAAEALAAVSAALLVNLGLRQQGFAWALAWILAALFVVGFAGKAARWASLYLAVTDSRLLIICGLFTSSVDAMALREVRDLSLGRSFGGRVFGYGALRSASWSERQAIFDYLPYPHQVYLEILAAIDPHVLEEPDDDEGGDEVP